MPSRIALSLLLTGLLQTAQAADPVYEAYAVRYATLTGYPVSSLVAGAEKDRKLDIAMMVWVLKGPERTVLVDAGFYRPRYLSGRKDVADFVRPDRAVERLGIKPEEVTDVIISHTHWDHLDGADLFPKATIWIQKAEYAHYTGQVKQDGELNHLSALVKLHDAGRVRLVDGDAKEIIPGVTVYTGGKHTFESEYVGEVEDLIEDDGHPASDNVYLYENLDETWRPSRRRLSTPGPTWRLRIG